MFRTQNTGDGQIKQNMEVAQKIAFESLILYNISQIISESTLFSKVRNIKILNPVLSCFLCTSVWASFALTFVLFDYAKYLGYETVSWFWNGLFFSSITWFIHCVETKLLE